MRRTPHAAPVGSPNANPDLLAALTRAAARQEALVEAPLQYATVLGFRDGHAPESSTFCFGTAVETVDAEGAKRIGTVISDGEKDGRVFIVYEDGTEAHLPVAGEGSAEGSIRILPHNNARVVVELNGRHLEVRRPVGMDLALGDTVALHQTTMQIVSVVGRRGIGEIVTVKDVRPDGRCEISWGDTSRLVLPGQHAGTVTSGNLVTIDASRSVILENLGNASTGLKEGSDRKVPWDDVIGQDEAVAFLKEALIDPIKHEALNRRYRKPKSKGVVLKGPPGCGKTLLGSAAATAIAEAYDTKDGSGFLLVRGPEFFEGLVGKAESRIRSLFAYARRFERERGYKLVVFLDECDAMLRRRGSGISSDATDSIVNTFLVEMDGGDLENPFLMLATNRHDIIDPAIYRPGRIDRQLTIRRPDRTAVDAIFRLNLGKYPLGVGESIPAMAAAATTALFSSNKSFARLTVKAADGEAERLYTFGDVVSGAIVEGAVNRAVSLAYVRDRDHGTETGVSTSDLFAAIDQMFVEHEVDQDEFEEFRRTIPDPVSKIERLRQRR